MRLTPAQIDTIQSTAQAVLGDDVQVWLYGSRLDEHRKGGDIDLLIESSQKASIMSRAKIKYQVETALQLPVDILMVQRGRAAGAFQTIARARAVRLKPPTWAHQTLQWPISGSFLAQNKKDKELFEALAAINERFAKLQDTLGAAMRHSLVLSGEQARVWLARVLAGCPD
eukprot:gene24301-27489_t